ncbi:MAG TPA: CocE/NonD family hydrolase [Bryobacteraceae bacterium]|jgi:hypothetical protein|nr:CocE/NonD family hydrolase [Bryobacteraceae bacterium]
MVDRCNPLFQLRKLLVRVQQTYSPFICQFTISVMQLSRILSAILCAASGSLALTPDFKLPDNYTKFEYRIPMRDGVRLFTAVYVPKDRSQKYPFLVTRTPYSVAPYGLHHFPRMLGPGSKFAAEKFIFVYQDVRGRFMSEGVWKEMTPEHNVHSGPKDADESTDTYDTIDWLLKNVPGNNGKAGLVGISYPGFYTSAGMIDAHPALLAASPQAPVSDLYMGDDAFHNGAFFLAANFSFYRIFGKQDNPTSHAEEPLFSYPTKDGYAFYLDLGSVANSNPKYFHFRNLYWTDVLDHPNYDAFWKERDILPHLQNIRPAVLVVGGWFDAEDLAGTLKTFRDIETQSPNTKETLVMGPWSHGGWARTEGDRLGDIHFDAKTSDYFQNEIELPFFLHYLKGAADPKLSRAIVFETGKNRWHNEDQWPPSNTQTMHLYFRASRSIDQSPPTEAGAFDEYVSDPNNPVPFVAKPTDAMPREYMDADQRFLEGRADVLTYVTKPLETDLTMVGPVSPKLFVATTGTDSDYVVKLIDVFPDAAASLAGYRELVRGEPFRGKFRHSFERPAAFVPAHIEKIAFSMPDIDHCFLKGHRIMIQIQSSWFPLVDRNPQTFTNIPTAKPDDYRTATERVYRSADAASEVEVRVECPSALESSCSSMALK